MTIKIGIDLDCVLNNLNHKWIEVYNQSYNDDLSIEDIKSWDIIKYVKPECGVKIYELVNDDLLSQLTPLPYAVEITQELMKEHDLYIVTATEIPNIKPKAEWVNKFYPHIGVDKMVITRHKHLINVDLLIDDAPHNIMDFPRKTIVMDYAWNRNLPNSYPRAHNWEEVKILIKKLKEN
ncbi:5' nucleotidase, NT5C type [Bacillus smithii]|uniref:5' nucleotidase, NT5C type n=1 Tax=Bacillus smithii TaxID=1479 RepID=UPI003D1AB1DD